MREAKQTTIVGASGNAVTYTVGMLAPTPALALLTELVKTLGPALSPVFANVGSLSKFLESNVEDVKTDFLGEAVTALCTTVNEQALDRIIKTLCRVTTVDGVPLDKVYELHFAKEGLGALFQLLPFALRVQYDDVFTVLGSAIKSAPRHLPTAPLQ